MPLGRPTISLFVLTRDQDLLLQRCLEHHRPIYDEAIVVDSNPDEPSCLGMQNSTVKIFHFPWCDDFSQARNFGISKATADWVLQIDCDEIISENDFSSIRSLTQGTPDRCFALPQLNYFPTSRGAGWKENGPANTPFCLGAQGYHTAWALRLFPNNRGIEYQGVVHETIDKSVELNGLGSCRANISLHHQGHMLEYPRPQGRTGFYGQLLIKKVRQQPDSPMARYELAVHLAGVGKRDLAQKWLTRTLAEFPFWAGSYRAKLLLGEIRLGRGQKKEAATLFDQALAERPDLPGCWEGVIASRIALDDRMGAQNHLKQARTLFPSNQSWGNLEAQVSTTNGR